MNIQELYKLYKKSYLISTDTRRIKPNSLFFALKGENFNGNKFAEQALEKGASYAIVDEAIYQTSSRTILVENVLETMQSLARYHRNQLGIPIISLTGSNGKTTTKELINAVLSTTFTTTATLGNLNNHIGVPLTLLSMTPETEIGIVEMGANHLKEIEFLCAIALPDFGYITNFGKAHLEGFGSVEGVVKGKTELYQYLKENQKIVFVNATDSKQLALSKEMLRITFGNTNEADVSVTFIEADPFVALAYNSKRIKSKLIGAYNFNNIAAAIAIGNYFKVKKDKIYKAIENYKPDNNRSQIIIKDSLKIILDAYNANPSSMEVALMNLANLTDKKKVAIIGDMFELGDTSRLEHQRIADLVDKLSIDSAILIGENFYKAKISNSKILKFKTFDEFKGYFSELKITNATLLIKASRGMALERVLDLI